MFIFCAGASYNRPTETKKCPWLTNNWRLVKISNIDALGLEVFKAIQAKSCIMLFR